MVNVWNNLKDLLGIGALNKSNKLDAAYYNKLIAGEDVDTEPVQQEAQQPVKQDTLLMTPDGQVDYAASVKLKQQSTPLSLFDRIRGREVHIDKETIDPKTKEVTTERFSDFKPGILNDISAGYKENRTTPISLDNFGQNKGFATRLGEGLGSIARFADSPAGRALIMGGIVGATGGSGLQALAYGGGAGLGNQQNRMKDRLYRNALEQQGVDTTGINGYVGDTAFAKLVDANIAQENAAYRRMYYDQQNQNQKDMMQWRIQQAEAEQRQRQFENYLKSRGLDLEYAKFKAGLDKPQNGVANLAAVSNQLSRFEKSFKNMPGKLESNTLGRIRNATGLQTETEANFNSQRTLLFNKIARDLGGEKGVLSDQDIKRIEKALPDYTDSYAQKQAKMQAIYALLEDRLNAEGLSLSTNNNNDPLGIR